MKGESLLPTVEKYIGNAKAAVSTEVSDGRIRLTIGKEFRDYEGIPAETRKRFNVALRPGISSVEQLKRTSDDILSTAENVDAVMSLAGRDYPYHITILELRQEDGDISPETEEMLACEIARNEIIQGASTTQVSLDYFFIDKGGNVIFAAKQIPQEIIDARDEIARIGEKYGLKPLLLTNILHMSAARPLKVPSMDKRPEYYRMSEARSVINKNPVVVRGQISGKTAWNLLNELNT